MEEFLTAGGVPLHCIKIVGGASEVPMHPLMPAYTNSPLPFRVAK